MVVGATEIAAQQRQPQVALVEPRRVGVGTAPQLRVRGHLASPLPRQRRLRLRPLPHLPPRPPRRLLLRPPRPRLLPQLARHPRDATASPDKVYPLNAPSTHRHRTSSRKRTTTLRLSKKLDLQDFSPLACAR